MSECCSFVPEEAKKEEYTVYTDELAKEVGVDQDQMKHQQRLMSLTTGCFHTSTTVTIAWHFVSHQRHMMKLMKIFMNHLTNWINVWKQTDFYSEITLLTVMYEHTSH